MRRMSATFSMNGGGTGVAGGLHEPPRRAGKAVARVHVGDLVLDQADEERRAERHQDADGGGVEPLGELGLSAERCW